MAPYGASEAAQSTARSSTVTPKERQAQSKRAHSGHSAAISSGLWPERSHFERTVATAQPFRAHCSHSALETAALLSLIHITEPTSRTPIPHAERTRQTYTSTSLFC